ncbi:MAG TPA: pyridoxal-dependent decarboxylase [Streptosporangiaceae bacterium]|jgi:glutamate/tyrosine decarboxylase-like PLP-dependent enzyme
MHSVDATTEQMIRSVLAYAEDRLRLDPVPLDRGSCDPADLDAALSSQLGGTPGTGGPGHWLLGEHGHDPDLVLAAYASTLAPAVISADSPRFLGFIPAAPTKAALLFDMLVSCASIQGISWLEAAGAIHAENQVLNLIAQRAGLPETAGGCFVAGGSAANLSALAVAREMAKRRSAGHGAPDGGAPAGPAPEGGAPDGGQYGAQHGRRWRVIVGSDAHSSVASTLRLLEMDPLVVTAPGHRLTGAAVRAAIAADPDPGSLAAMVATSGTTNAGIIDDLASLAGVAREYGLWFHVDGAYGGAGLFAPSVRDRYAGLEHADSFVVDPHKWLFAPYDCAALLYREPALARSVHRQDASYLDVIHEQPAEWNPTDYAYHLTRRARGLPLWFSLAVHGTAAYTAAIEAAIALARAAADEIRSRPDLELICEPDLSVVLFRRRGWAAADYTRWADQLLADQVAFLPPTSWEGETVARLAFLHPHTPLSLVADVLDRMTDEAPAGQ